VSAAANARRRIEDAHRYDAIYGGGLASHHPMAIAALDALGASDEDIARFESRYLPNLRPMQDAVVVIQEGDEAAHLGSPRAFPEWVVYFSAAIAREGADVVLRRWIARFMPAVAAAAFHGAIRTAYALESDAKDELAHGLAYWAASYTTLPLSPQPGGRLSPIEVFAAISRDPAYAGQRPAARSITGNALAAARSPGFASHAASLASEKLVLDQIAAALLRAYAASGDFGLLHGVTGAHAFRVLSPFASDPAAALLDLWGAAVAMYMGAGAPPLDGWGLEGDDTFDWPAIRARAVHREDEHDIKLAYSCWREWQHRGDDLYRRAASARVA
jgi:hypothetical protein